MKHNSNNCCFWFDFPRDLTTCRKTSANHMCTYSVADEECIDLSVNFLFLGIKSKDTKPQKDYVSLNNGKGRILILDHCIRNSLALQSRSWISKK